MSSERAADHASNWASQADRDGCPATGHRYDLDCDWRSQTERTAHAFVTKAIHEELVTCTHKLLGTTCFDLATVALDALYENGWKVSHG